MTKMNRSLLAGCAASVLTAGAAQASILAAPTVVTSATPFNASYVAENTVNQGVAEYASQGQGLNTFVEYSFGSAVSFNRIVVINRDSGGQSDLIGNFTLTFDGGATTSVSRTAMRGASQFHDVGLRTATTVRLDVDSLGVGDAFNNTGAMEVIFALTPAGQTLIPGVTVANSAAAFSPEFDATNAVDGNIGRISGAIANSDWPEYASAGLGVDAFVDFDLGSVLSVGGFDWFDRPAEADRVTAFDMIFSQDAIFGNGDDVTRSYTNSAMAMGDVFAGINARYVRYDVTAAAGLNAGLSEMYFYQVPEPASLGVLALGLLLPLRRRRA